MNTIKVSNWLNPYQTWHFVGPDLSCKAYQQTTVTGKALNSMYDNNFYANWWIWLDCNWETIDSWVPPLANKFDQVIPDPDYTSTQTRWNDGILDLASMSL